MGLFTVVRIFTLTIFFNTILPTGDVYSDILLMVQTLTFQNTESLEMSGCRSCFGKSEEDLYPTLNDCETCLTKNTHFDCGRYISSLNKFREIKNRKKCENQKWVVRTGGKLCRKYFTKLWSCYIVTLIIRLSLFKMHLMNLLQYQCMYQNVINQIKLRLSNVEWVYYVKF